MPAQFNIPVPATPNTAGASVDISQQNSQLTVLSPDNVENDNISLQQSFDGATWATIAGVIGGPQSMIVDAEGTSLRAFRNKGSSGVVNIQAAGQNQLGAASTRTIAVPAAPGPTAGVDISAQPANLNLFFDASGGTVNVEASFDNVKWCPLVGLDGGATVNVQCGVNYLRANRPYGGSAGTLRINGIPAKGA